MSGTSSSDQHDNSFVIWLKSDVFLCGSLPVSPPRKLSVHAIKKIVNYAKSRGNAFPRLPYSVWKHIAVYKMSLSEEIAWTYFETYIMLTSSPVDRLRIITDLNKAKNLETKRAELDVDTMQFVLLLFVQFLSKVDLRSSCIDRELCEEWPRAPTPNSGRKSGGSKTLNENSHLAFCRQNLNQILSLVSDPDTSGSTDVRLTIDSIYALDFLFGASVSGNAYKLSELAMNQSIQSRCGFSKISQTFSFHQFESWMRGLLGINPYGITTCLSKGRRLSWPLAFETKEEALRRGGHITTNRHLQQYSGGQGLKTVHISHCSKQTLCRGLSSTLHESYVKISHCHNSTLYLLSPIRAISIENCRGSTICLGPVKNAVFVTSCQSVVVISPCFRFMVSNSVDVSAYLLTPCRPLILSGNDNVTMAPFNTHYDSLMDHLGSVGIPPNLNYWNQPFCMGPDHDMAAPSWKLLDPELFFEFAVPFNIEGQCKAFPNRLPPAYAQALAKHEEMLKKYKKDILSGLNSHQRKEVEDIIQQCFKDWLRDEGHLHEIEDLSPGKPTPNN